MTKLGKSGKRKNYNSQKIITETIKIHHAEFCQEIPKHSESWCQCKVCRVFWNKQFNKKGKNEIQKSL